MTSTAIRQTNLAASNGATGDRGSAARMYSLRVREVWQGMRQQPLSFWLVCLYMLFEYVRPQAIYPAIAVLPWARILILLAPVAYLLEGGRLKAKDPVNTWMVVFSLAVLASWMFAVDPQASQDKISIYVNWVLVYLLVANVVSTEARFFLFFGLFLLASLKMSQHGARSWALRGFSFANWGATGAPGWFHNSGEFGIQMCVFFPLALYYIGALRKYWEKWKHVLMLLLPVTAIMSLIATNSRGAIIGAAAVGVWMLARTQHRVRSFVALGALAAVVYLVMPAEQKERFRSMGDDTTSENRILYWERGIEAFKAHPITGIGYENWSGYYYATYNGFGLPHNIFVQGGAELGTLGLIGMVGLIASSFLVNKRTRRLASSLGERGRFMEWTARGLDGAMIGFLASGFFVTVLFYPYLWFALGLTSALHTAAVHAASTGPPLPGLQPVPQAIRTSGWRSATSAMPVRARTPVIVPRRSH